MVETSTTVRRIAGSASQAIHILPHSQPRLALMTKLIGKPSTTPASATG
jgi:hypothetical protein